MRELISKQISSCIEESWTGSSAWIEIQIDRNTVRRLGLEISLSSIKESIAAAPKMKISISSINVSEKNYRIRVYIDMLKGKNSDTPGDGLFERLKFLKRGMSNIQIKGMSKVDRGVISIDDKKEVIDRLGGPKHCLLVTGYGLSEVMGTDGEFLLYLLRKRKIKADVLL